MGIAALLAAPAMIGTRKRWAASGAVVAMVAAASGAAYCNKSDEMIAWLALLGTGAGLLLAAVNAIIAAIATPHRLFGHAFMAAYAVAALLVFAMAPAIARAGHHGAFGVLAVAAALTLPWMWALPQNTDANAEVAEHEIPNWRAGVVLLFGIAVIGLAMMGFYAYIERLGAHFDLSLDHIATIFAAQQIASVLGAATAASLGLRFGLPRTVAVSTVLHTVAVMLAVFGGTRWFAVGVVTEGLTFLFLLPLLFTIAAQLDVNGRWAAAANGALFLSTGVAPLLIGKLIKVFDYSIIGWLMLAVTPLGVCAFAFAQKAGVPR